MLVLRLNTAGTMVGGDRFAAYANLTSKGDGKYGVPCGQARDRRLV